MQSNNPTPSQQASSEQVSGTSTTSASMSPLSEVAVSNSPISASDLQQHIQSLVIALGRGSPHTQFSHANLTPVHIRPTTSSFNPPQYINPMPTITPRDVHNGLQFDAPTPTAASESAAPIITTQTATKSQSNAEHLAVTKTERIDKSAAAPLKPSTYGWGDTKQEATAHAAITLTKEQITQPSTEHSLVTTKTPTHAVEKALETMLQGASSDPIRTSLDRPVIREAQMSQSNTLDISREHNGLPERAHTVTPGATHSPEQVSRDASLLNQSSVDKGGNADLTATSTSSHVLEQRSEQRTEQIRVLQQIVAAEFEPPTRSSLSAVTDALRTSLDLPPSIHPRHESTTVSVQTLRDGLLSKFEAIQSQIQTSTTERQTLEQHRHVVTTSTVQGRSDFLKSTPIHHNATPESSIQRADRSDPISTISKILAEAPRTLSSLMAPGTAIGHRSTPQQELSQVGPVNTDALDRLIGLLKKFSKRSTNFELMKRMDSTLEQTCLSLVTVVALGVVGIEVMMRLAHAALAALLKELRDTQQKESAQSQADEQLQAELEAELDTYLSDIVEKDDIINSVVDVSGIIISSETGEPLPGILIGSRELGSTVSDGDGSFGFRNIPYGVSYSLNLYKGAFQVSPTTVKGVSGEASMHRIEVTLTPILRR